MQMERDARVRGSLKANRPLVEIMEDYDLSHEDMDRIYNDWVTDQRKRGKVPDKGQVGKNEFVGEEVKPDGR